MSDESSRALLGLLNQQRSGASAASTPAATSTGGDGGGALLNLLSAMKPAKTPVEKPSETSPIKGISGRKVVGEESNASKPQNGNSSMAEGLRQLLTSGISDHSQTVASPEAKESTVHTATQMFSNIPLASSISTSESTTHGVRLTPPVSQISIEHANSEMISNRKLDGKIVSQINVPLEYHAGSLISVIDDYLAYSTKGGKIRVINKINGMKALLKGHFQQISDLQFFPGYRGNENERLIASISLEGSLIIWNVLNTSSIDSELQYNIILEISGDTSSVGQFRRVFWSHNDPNLLYFVTSQNEVYRLNISELTQSGSRLNMPGNAMFPNIRGLTKLLHQNQPIKDVCLSQNGCILAVASQDGLVRIWNALECKPSISAINILNAGPVNSVLFAEPAFATANPSHMITGSNNNSVIEIWNINTRTKSHSLSLEQSQVKSSDIFNILQYCPKTDFLFISCPARSSIFVAHFHGTSKAPVSFFDFIVEYPLNQPVLSLSIHVKDRESLSMFCMHPKSVDIYRETIKSIYDAEVVVNLPFHSSFIPSRLTSPKSLDIKAPVDEQYLMSPTTSRLLSPKSITNPLASSASMPTFLKKTASTEDVPVSSPVFQEGKPGLIMESNKDLVGLIRGLFEEQNMKLEAERKSREAWELEKFDTLSRRLSQNINSTILSSLETVVKAELQKTILPVVEKTIEKSVAKTTQDYLRVNSAALEKNLQDSLGKSISKLNISEKVSELVVSGAESALAKAMEEKLIPAYQGVTKEMFKQVNSAFGKGLKEAFDSFTDLTAKKIDSCMQKTEEKLVKDIKGTLNTEIKALALLDRSKASQVTSGSEAQPSSAFSREAILNEINALISAKSYQAAFVKALSCNDLSVVISLCCRLSPKDLFTAHDDGSLTLSPPVVISLIQQLSVDTSSDVDLKLAWLREALFSLPTNDPDIAHHVPSVLNQLVRNLEDFCVKNASASDQVIASLVRKSRLIVQLAQSLLAGF